MIENTGNSDQVTVDHRQPGPPPSVALHGASTENHDLDVLAGCLYGGEPQ